MRTRGADAVDPIVDAVEQLTPDWLTDALRTAGHDLTVAAASAEPIGAGQMGATFRLHLTYAGVGGPPTLVAKIGAGDRAARAQVSPGYASEVGFYTRVATTVDVRTPRCWYSAIADDNERFTLLLDDVLDAIPIGQADGCTVTQAGAAIANLTGLHAPRWNDPTLFDLDFLMRPSGGMATMMDRILGTATESFLRRYEDQLVDGEPATLRAVAEAIGAWFVARPEPFAVVHGDYRLDNLLFTPSGDEVVAIDWQTAALGPPLRDVAYFTGSSLDIEDRRAHEEELVAGYYSALVDCGVEDYSAALCWDDYRLGHLQGPMVTVIGCMYASGDRTEGSDAMFLSMTRRSCAAITDLGSLELL